MGNTLKQEIKDNLGRSFKKLRLSLTDACNFRCIYCMPENQKFQKFKTETTPEEFFYVCKNLVDYGVDEIRITGGEPLFNKDFLRIVELLSDLPLKTLALTTNAFYLKRYLAPLKNTNLSSINISLDSLNKEKFQQITKSNSFDRVMETILMARELGFKIKTNTVLMKGINDDEVEDFMKFSQQTGITVRFLEAMNIGVLNHDFKKVYLPVKEIKSQLEDKYGLIKEEVAWDSTSQVYSPSKESSLAGAMIGFIASESMPFCNTCTRLRVNHKLEIRPCLFLNQSLSLRNVKPEEYPEILGFLLSKKPTTRIKSIKQPMFEIGG